MASGKRASMREGPLAALFRKTEEHGLEDEVPAPESPEPRRAAPHGGRGGARRGRRGRAAHPHAAGAAAPRLLLGDPREHPGARARSLRALGGARAVARARERRQPGAARGGRGRGRRQRRQPDGGGRGRGRRLPRHQHRPAIPPAVGRPPDAAHRRRPHAGPRLGVGPRPRAPVRDGRARPHQVPAQGLGHDLHHRRRRWRHGNGRRAHRRADRPGAGGADGGHRDQAVRLRGLPPRRAGAGGRRAPGRRGRHADRRPQQPAAVACSTSRPRWWTRSAWPTTSCARACRASPTW